MPSTAFTSLHKMVAVYIDGAKATEIIKRQLETSKFDPDKVTSQDLKTIANRLAVSCALYVADTGKRAELKEKLASI